MLRHSTFDKKFAIATRFFLTFVALSVMAFILVNIGAGVIDGISGTVPLVLGFACLALGLVAFALAVRAERRA